MDHKGVMRSGSEASLASQTDPSREQMLRCRSAWLLCDLCQKYPRS